MYNSIDVIFSLCVALRSHVRPLTDTPSSHTTHTTHNTLIHHTGLGSAGSFDMDMDMGMGTGMMDSASLGALSGNVDLMAGQAATAATEFSQVSPFRRLTEGEDKGEGGDGVDVTGATSTGTQEASTGTLEGQGGGTTVRTTVSPASTKTQVRF